MTESNLLCACMLRLSILVGLLSVVVTIIYYTPIPDFGNYTYYVFVYYILNIHILNGVIHFVCCFMINI